MWMDLLTGNYRNTLDEKGRILFPSRLRTELEKNILIITQGLDRCLWIFTHDEWNSLSSKLIESASPFQSKDRLVLRRLIAPAQEVEIDKTGRLSIPQSLREYAGLTKDCVFLGISKYIELWDAASYEKYLAGTDEEFCEATESLGGIRF